MEVEVGEVVGRSIYMSFGLLGLLLHYDYWECSRECYVPRKGESAECSLYDKWALTEGQCGSVKAFGGSVLLWEHMVGL